MPRKDLKHNLIAKQALASTNVTGNGTTTGNIIDLHGYEGCVFFIVGDTLTDGSYAPVLTAGNDPALADGVAVDANFIQDSLTDSTLAATDDNKAKSIGYNGGFRYIRLDIAASGVTTGGHVSVLAVLGIPLDAPTTTD